MIEITQNFYQANAKGAIHRWLTTLCLTAAFCLSAVVQASAADLTTWQLNSTTALTAIGTVSNLTASDAVLGSGCTGTAIAYSGGGTTAYATVTATTAATSILDAIAKNNYMQFDLTVAAGYNLTIAAVDALKVFLAPRGSGAINIELYYSVNGGAYAAFSSTIVTGSGSASPTSKTFATTSTIAVPGTQKISFRVYFYGVNTKMGIRTVIPVGTVSAACVNPAIASVTAPASSICASATQTLTATGVVGTNASVTWSNTSGGASIGGGNTLANRGPGTYYAKVTGDCGTPAEASITVTALAPTGIGSETLAAATYLKNDLATPLSVTATGGGTLTYQWYSSIDNLVDVSDAAVVGANSNSYPPSTATAGTTYYYCIVTGCNAVTSNISGAIVVNAPLNDIITGAVTGAPFCKGGLGSVAFTSTGTYTDNTYTAQLSNASGSFSSPVEIGTLDSDDNSGSINVTIPSGAVAGTGYRIRVVASSPGATGNDNGSNLAINADTSISTQPANASINVGDDATFTVVANGAGFAYQWQVSADGTIWSSVSEGTALGTNSYTNSTSATLTVNNATTAITGYKYQCVVTGDCGVAVTTNGAATLTVSVVTNDNDYFRSAGNGDWSVAATWEASTDGTNGWHTSSKVPDTLASAITILNTHVVTITNTTAITADDITVAANGRLNVANGGTLIVNNGAAANDLILNGYMYCANGGTITSNGTIQANSGSTYEEGRNSTTATISLPTITWVAGSTCKLSGNYSFNGDIGTVATPLIIPNIWINCNITDAVAGRLNLQLLNTTSSSLQNVTIENTGAGPVFAVAGAGSVTVASFTQTGGNFMVNRNGGGTRTMTVTGNVNISGGTFDLKSGTSNATAGVLNVGGNFIISSGGAVTLSGTTSSSGSVVAFNGAAQTFSNAGTFSGAIDVTVATNAILSIGTGQNIPVKSLKLGALGTASGTWGSTSSAATYTNNTYFASTNGTVNVATDTRATPTVTPTGGPYTYTGAAQGPNSATNTGTSSNYTYSYVGVGATTYGPIATQPTNAGTYNVTATVAASTDGFYKTASSSATPFIINKATQTITAFTAFAVHVVGDGITLPATTDSGLPIVYLSIPNPDTDVVSISGNTLTITGAGTTTITASQAGDANYASLSVSHNLAVLQPCIWGVTGWTPNAPSVTDAAIINAAYSTSSNGVFTAKNLIINSDKVLTINSGYNLTIQNRIINIGAATGLVVQSNANLIQVNNVANLGQITVNRDSNSLYRLDYTMWSSPVAPGQTLAKFSPLTATNRFYVYNEGTDLYNAVPSTGTFSLGKGYLIRMPNENPESRGTTTPYYLGTLGSFIPYHGVFTGVPNNGTIPVALTTTKDGFNAVGNPYPSAINIDTFISANAANIDGTLWFWRKRNDPSNLTSYSTCTSVGCALVNGAVYTDDNTISVGQGFIVKAISSSLNFTNNMRVGGTTNQFFKTKKVVDKNRVWLNLGNGTTVLSQALVAYVNGATQGVDNGIDGRYINDSPVALTSNINNEEYTIQGRALPFDPTDVVPLNFKTDVAGNYTIAIDHVDGLFAAGQEVILVDNTTGKETDLTTGGYTFTAAAGADNARFALKYQKTLGVDAATLEANGVIVYKNKGILSVNSSVEIANIKVYDVQGKLVTELNKVNATSATIANLDLANQVLMVQVTLEDNKVVTKKVVN